MRLLWTLLGIALLFCMVMCAYRDAQGDEMASAGWAGACIALGIVACLMYGFEYAPWWKVVDGRPVTELNRPWMEEPELPVVYDQPIETRM